VKLLSNLLIFLGISALFSVLIYFFDIWLLFAGPLSYLGSYYSPLDAFFLEGLLLLFLGDLFLLGRGGIDIWTMRAAILSALTGTFYDEDTLSASKVFRKNRWKPEGFTRFALILILTGISILILTGISILILTGISIILASLTVYF
jgi:hypothetical protein